MNVFSLNAWPLNFEPFPSVTTNVDLMSAVATRLKGDSTVLGVFGVPDLTPRFHADEIDPGSTYPCLLHTNPTERPRRFFGGRIGQGEFELGAFSAGYEASQTLLETVRASVDTWIDQKGRLTLGDGGKLFYCRSLTGTTRSIRVPAPGSGVTQYGRAIQFTFKISRDEPAPSGPSMPNPDDVISGVFTRLNSDSRVLTAFNVSDLKYKFHADEIDPEASLPYILHSSVQEAPDRFFGGRIGMGTFELGVFDSGYETARAKMDLVRTAIDSWVSAAPQDLRDSGKLFYIRSQEETARSISVPAPGGGVTQYGRVLQFGFKVAREA